MSLLGGLAIASLFFLLSASNAVLLMWLIRPRWLAWLINALLILGLAYLSLFIAGVFNPRDQAWFFAADLLILWPLPLILIGMQLTPTHRPPLAPGHCPCGYDLTGNATGVCPECGHALG